MAGTNGGKVRLALNPCSEHRADNFQFPEIREHFQKNIGDVYKGLDLTFRGFPESNLRNAEACQSVPNIPPLRKTNMTLL